MFDAKKMLDQFMGAAENFAGKENVDKVKKAIADNPGMAKAAGVGLAAVLLGTRAGRRVTGNAVKLGGLAVVGGLAYQAYQNWQRTKGIETAGGQSGQGGELLPPPANSPFSIEPASEQDHARAFLTAMIAAAKADGRVDADEQKRIFGRMNELIDGAEAKAFLMDEMLAPNDLGRVVALAKTPEMAAEIYTASCMAIDLDHADERAWLDHLAAALKLEPSLTEEIERAVKNQQEMPA
jgi:uncharacterized membrane protein YebE (DUF533 family)